MSLEYTENSDNVFRDIGSISPEEKLAKTELIFIIRQIIKDRQLTSKEAANILGVDQSEIANLKNGKLSGFSIESLFSFLSALDQDIDIVVHGKSQKSDDNTIHVAYA